MLRCRYDTTDTHKKCTPITHPAPLPTHAHRDSASILASIGERARTCQATTLPTQAASSLLFIEELQGMRGCVTVGHSLWSLAPSLWVFTRWRSEWESARLRHLLRVGEMSLFLLYLFQQLAVLAVVRYSSLSVVDFHLTWSMAPCRCDWCCLTLRGWTPPFSTRSRFLPCPPVLLHGLFPLEHGTSHSGAGGLGPQNEVEY